MIAYRRFTVKFSGSEFLAARSGSDDESDQCGSALALMCGPPAGNFKAARGAGPGPSRGIQTVRRDSHSTGPSSEHSTAVPRYHRGCFPSIPESDFGGVGLSGSGAGNAPGVPSVMKRPRRMRVLPAGQRLHRRSLAVVRSSEFKASAERGQDPGSGLGW
eukprot:762510-Hanusia_phi.AAC.8